MPFEEVFEEKRGGSERAKHDLKKRKGLGGAKPARQDQLQIMQGRVIIKRGRFLGPLVLMDPESKGGEDL